MERGNFVRFLKQQINVKADDFIESSTCSGVVLGIYFI